MKSIGRQSSQAADASIGTRRRPTAPPERFTTRLQSIWGSSGIRNSFDTLWINAGARGHQENEPSRGNALHDHRTRTARRLARRANRSALPRDGVGRVGLELAGDEVCLLGMAAAVSAGLGRRDRCGGACALCCRNRRQPESTCGSVAPAHHLGDPQRRAVGAVMSYALLWLPASEAVVIAYTMPVWTALLAWPLLGERLTLLRVTALVMAFAGLASLFG